MTLKHRVSPVLAPSMASVGARISPRAAVSRAAQQTRSRTERFDKRRNIESPPSLIENSSLPYYYNAIDSKFRTKIIKI